MAGVRMSKRLKAQILSEAQSLFDEEHAEAVEAYPKDWGVRIIDKMYPDELLSQLEALPSGVVPRYTAIGFCGFRYRPATVLQSEWDTLERIRKQQPIYEFTLDLPEGKFLWGFHEVSSEHGKHLLELLGVESMVGLSVTLDASDPRWADILEEYKAYCANVELVNTRINTHTSNIKTLLDASTTLAAALRAWPPLWDLLSAEVRQRHKDHTPVKKKDVTPPSPDDLADVTAKITAARLQR